MPECLYISDHVCEWQPAASCSNTFEYENKTYQGCSYDGEVTDPWCEMTSTQCTKTCQKHDLGGLAYSQVMVMDTFEFQC